MPPTIKQGGDAVEHAAMDRVLADHVREAEAEEEVDRDGDDCHLVVAQAERGEAIEEQHRHGGGGEAHGFAQRDAGVAIDVGEHAGETAHRAGHERGIGRHAVRVADAGIGGADDAAKGDVGSESGHCGSGARAR